MSMIKHDMNDDEIRIISRHPDAPQKKSESQSRFPWTTLILAISIVMAVILLIIFFNYTKHTSAYDHLEIRKELKNTPSPEKREAVDSIFSEHPYVEILDTLVGNEHLTIFIPRFAKPRLHVGTNILQDDEAVFVLQAADVRKDNGGIVGAYVLQGELLSRGQSKAGFCAIINDELTVGVSDATPYLEKAIENDGDFFRQYPLVVAGQMVENKLKLSSLRRALAEWNGETVVVMSRNRMTLNQFAETLVDLGVTNAIYLIGSASYGFAKDENGDRIIFGQKKKNPAEKSNYIVWE